jgi:FkbM family methyltransferase
MQDQMLPKTTVIDHQDNLFSIWVVRLQLTEMDFTNRTQIGSISSQRSLRPKYLMFLCLTLSLFWILSQDWSKAIKNNTSRNQDSHTLATFTSPFDCDPKTLPKRARIIRRAHEDYVILGHGFKDVVTDYEWKASDYNTWETAITRQLELFLKAIATLEPARSIYVDLGVNIGTHMLHVASRGYNTHGFEPLYANYVLAHCALSISGITSPVRFNHFGLSDKVETVCLDSVSWNIGDTAIGKAENCQLSKQASMDTLNNYYQTFLQGQKVAVMKIDIQGSEVAALEHGTALFDSNDAPEVVMFEYEPDKIRAQSHEPAQLVAYFEQRNYSIWHLGIAPYGIRVPRFINGTSIAWRDSDISSFDDFFGYFDLIAIKKAWKEKAERAGLKFIGETLAE